MKAEFKLATGGCRVWLGETPFEIDSETLIEKLLPSTLDAAVCNAFVCGEWFRRVGARIDYGLLGWSFQPEKGAKVRLKVPVSESHDVFDTALASHATDDIYKGLPQGFAEVVSGLVCEGEIGLPSGVAKVCTSAYSSMYSNLATFSVLANFTSKLLFVDPSSTDTHALKKLMVHSLRYYSR